MGRGPAAQEQGSGQLQEEVAGSWAGHWPLFFFPALAISLTCPQALGVSGSTMLHAWPLWPGAGFRGGMGEGVRSGRGVGGEAEGSCSGSGKASPFILEFLPCLAPRWWW